MGKTAGLLAEMREATVERAGERHGMVQRIGGHMPVALGDPLEMPVW